MKIPFLAGVLVMATCASLSFWAFSSDARNHKTIVLVHGAHQTKFAWDSVVKKLRGKQIRVQSINLPGRDGKSNPTLYDMESYLCEAIKKLPGRIILVGHSQGGAVINQAFGSCGRRVDGLVYVAGVVPKSGETAFDLLKSRDEEWYFKAITHDSESDYYRIVDKDKFVESFAQDVIGKPDLAQLVKSNAVDEPGAIAVDRLTIPEGKLERAKKFYIHTNRDRILTLETQKKYSSRMNMRATFFLDAAHLPMISADSELVDCFEKILSM